MNPKDAWNGQWWNPIAPYPDRDVRDVPKVDIRDVAAAYHRKQKGQWRVNIAGTCFWVALNVALLILWVVWFVWHLGGWREKWTVTDHE
jgi:hypothetical protein